MTVPFCAPLHWPAGFPRTLAHDRRRSHFGPRGDGHIRPWAITQAYEAVLEQLRLLGTDRAAISSDLPVTATGWPCGETAGDPAVALYFLMEQDLICLPCDRWLRCADNLHAIAKYIEAQRGMNRWGVGTVQQALLGFRLLPAPGGELVPTEPRACRSVQKRN